MCATATPTTTEILEAVDSRVPNAGAAATTPGAKWYVTVGCVTARAVHTVAAAPLAKRSRRRGPASRSALNTMALIARRNPRSCTGTSVEARATRGIGVATARVPPP